MGKTNTGLVAYAKAQLGKPYWYGCYGQIGSDDLYERKKKQYPKYYTATDFKGQYGQRVHDCVGLIKGYLWSDSADAKPKYNAAQDKSANGMLAACKEKGAISTMPDIAGILVFMSGHVGVYIGNGEVIEARGHAYGVVKTKLASRKWKNWGKCPYITYESKSPAPDPALKVGDRVRLLPDAVYHNGKSIPLWVKKMKLYVRGFRTDGYVTISTQKTGAITGAVDKKFLKKI